MRSKPPRITTIRGILLFMFFVGCALAVWRFNWGQSLPVRAAMSLLLLGSLGAAVGAPFGSWARGAVVGLSSAVVGVLLFGALLLAFVLGG
jgi:hypothetical protein